eukprot:scaffold1954_cov268-Pinguiococcus_pyrenoidosus.AAC.262
MAFATEAQLGVIPSTLCPLEGSRRNLRPSLSSWVKGQDISTAASREGASACSPSACEFADIKCSTSRTRCGRCDFASRCMIWFSACTLTAPCPPASLVWARRWKSMVNHAEIGSKEDVSSAAWIMAAAAAVRASPLMRPLSKGVSLRAAWEAQASSGAPVGYSTFSRSSFPKRIASSRRRQVVSECRVDAEEVDLLSAILCLTIELHGRSDIAHAGTRVDRTPIADDVGFHAPRAHVIQQQPRSLDTGSALRARIQGDVEIGEERRQRRIQEVLAELQSDVPHPALRRRSHHDRPPTTRTEIMGGGERMQLAGLVGKVLAFAALERVCELLMPRPRPRDVHAVVLMQPIERR